MSDTVASCGEMDKSPHTNSIVTENAPGDSGRLPLMTTTPKVQMTEDKQQPEKKSHLQLFVLNMCLLLLFYMFMMVYSNGVIRTIERRFGLNSKQSGMIQSANDIMHVCIVVFIGYFGQIAHKPRIICITILFSAFAGYMMASPHFLFSTYVSPLDQSKPRNLVQHSGNYTTNLSASNLCVREENASMRGDQCDFSSSDNVSDNAGTVHPAFYVFVIAQLISGVGGSGIHTLSLAYIDENSPSTRSSFYIGIFTSMYAFGPMGGLMLSAVTLRLPENLLSVPHDTPSDASWIGCWWLGYVICATGLLATSIPLWFFPKFSKTEKNSLVVADIKEKDNETGSTGEDRQQITASVAKQEIKKFPRRLMHLLRNRAFVVVLISVVCGAYVVIGIFINLVRYIEIHFMERAFVGSLIAGLVSAFGGAIGGFTGGLIMSKLRIRPKGAVKMMIFSGSIFSSGIIVILFLSCPQLKMAGQQVPEDGNRFSVITNCNMDCACSTSRKSYVPVCGSDNLTYFSACAAGCKNFSNGIYSDCDCIGTPASRDAGREHVWPSESARPGICRPPCNLLIPFAVTLFIMSFCGSIGRVPSTVVTFRIVGDDERSFALSLISFAINLLGFAPAPMLFGTLIDSTCLLWQTKCRQTGECLLFNTAKFRYVTYGVALVFELVDLVLTFTLFFFIRKMAFPTDEEKQQMSKLAVNANGNEPESAAAMVTSI